MGRYYTKLSPSQRSVENSCTEFYKNPMNNLVTDTRVADRRVPQSMTFYFVKNLESQFCDEATKECRRNETGVCKYVLVSHCM
jgi:hypothetical protein